jgi:F0F1-type ATP synthase membrane subunit b/b'
MDMVLGIFAQLGADKTLWYQFAIIIVMYLLSKALFFGHLQNILESRIEKTVGLEGSAEKQFDEINRLAANYKEKIGTATKSAKAKLDADRAEISKSLESNYKSEEKKINDYIDESRKESEANLQIQKDKILNDAEDLANSLVQKITRG